MDNYYYNKEVVKLMDDIDILTKKITELRNIIKKQEDTIEYQKFMLDSVISMQ
jgi:hypothetical protein